MRAWRGSQTRTYSEAEILQGLRLVSWLVFSSLNSNDCWLSLHQPHDNVNFQLVPVGRKTSDLDFQRWVAYCDWYCRFGTALRHSVCPHPVDDDLIFHVNGIVEILINRKIV